MTSSYNKTLQFLIWTGFGLFQYCSSFILFSVEAGLNLNKCPFSCKIDQAVIHAPNKVLQAG